MRVTEPSSGHEPYEVACSRTGHYLIIGWGDQVLKMPVGFFRTTVPVFVLDRDGIVIASLGDFPGNERLGTSTGNRPHPFGRATVLAIGADRVFIGTGEAFEIQAYTLAGQPQQLFRAPSEDLSIRREHVAAYLDSRLAIVDDSIKPRLRREIPEMPLPEAFPAFSELHVDLHGDLWVRHHRRPGERTDRWSVFNPAGAIVATPGVPAGVRILEIGADYILGVHTDNLGVETLRMHHLTRGTQ
jgi:hypothetical protein